MVLGQYTLVEYFDPHTASTVFLILLLLFMYTFLDINVLPCIFQESGAPPGVYGGSAIGLICVWGEFDWQHVADAGPQTHEVRPTLGSV